MKANLFIYPFDLQLFADGAAGGGSGTGADGATGETAAAAVPQNAGESAPEGEGSSNAETAKKQAPTVDRNAEFDKMIKGEYKDLYDARVQSIVQSRLKGTRETVERYEALAPMLDLLARRYGIDATDAKALTAAIEKDDSYYEAAAMERGITVQQLKEERDREAKFRTMETENASLKRMVQEQKRKENASKLYAQWEDQAKATKSVYPSFDLQTEMRNEKFVDLLKNNIDVRTAFEVIHKDEIIPAAMQYTAKTVEQKIANKIAAGGMRPTENGNSSQGATTTSSDVSRATKAERAELNRRLARGERIVLPKNR